MRKLLENQKELEAAVATAPVKKTSANPIQEILTMKEYNSVVMEETEKMVVVRFHAPWCRVSPSLWMNVEPFLVPFANKSNSFTNRHAKL